MKTTENISLAGYAFTIESDAYTELAKYIDEIREAFKSDANADEITSDIEERIAELMREKCSDGMVVNKTMVQDIRHRIGNPQELVQDDTDQSAEKEQSRQAGKNWKSRRLYRNIDERTLGGVCSGLGAYFGLDKVLFRIAFLLLFVISFVCTVEDADGPYFMFPVIAYICLWIAMPAARTAEQRREMKGRPVNLDSYRSNGYNFGTEVKEAVESPAGQTFKRAGGIFLGLLLLLSGLGGMAGSVLIPAIPAIINHEIAEEISEWGPLGPEEQLMADMITQSETFWTLLIVMTGIMCVWFIYNGIMLIFNLKHPSWKPGLVLFISWVISIFILVGYLIYRIAENIPFFMT